MTTMADLGYDEATIQTYRAYDGLWYTAVQHETGEWTYSTPELHYDSDGHLYLLSGVWISGLTKVRVSPEEIGHPELVLHETPVVDPGYDPMPTDGLSLSKAAMAARGGKLSVASLVPEGKWFSKRGLFYREPEHGHWYESKWFWFCVALTGAFVMIWWFQMATDPTMGYAMLHPFSPAVDGDSVFLAWLGWVYWGWIFFLPGITGALQKEGYKRLAVVYAVGLTIVIHMFFSRTETVGNR